MTSKIEASAALPQEWFTRGWRRVELDNVDPIVVQPELKVASQHEIHPVLTVQLIHHNYKRVLYPFLPGSFTDPLLACIELYPDQLMASSTNRVPCFSTLVLCVFHASSLILASCTSRGEWVNKAFVWVRSTGDWIAHNTLHYFHDKDAWSWDILLLVNISLLGLFYPQASLSNFPLAHLTQEPYPYGI